MADRMCSVFGALCRWWFFGAVLGVVIGGGGPEPGMVAGVMLWGLVSGGILGSVPIVFNVLVTTEPAAE